jgi:hypothetical protein
VVLAAGMDRLKIALTLVGWTVKMGLCAR